MKIYVVFWIWVLLASAVLVLSRLSSRKLSGFRYCYVPLLVCGYVGSTLGHVRLYILEAVRANSDAAEGFLIMQTLINPLQLVVPARFVLRWLSPWPSDAVSTQPLYNIPVLLWESMTLDLILGSLLWAFLGFGTVRVLAKRSIQVE